jgi:hypothetical protein
MVSITSESPLSLSQATHLLPLSRQGRPVTLGCILRWILHGAKGPDGQRVRLEAIRLGGRWITSREALQRFAEALTPRLSNDPAPRSRTPRRRQKASGRAASELEKLGI